MSNYFSVSTDKNELYISENPLFYKLIYEKSSLMRVKSYTYIAL